jgi:predicted DNA binding CopG/RHH family protein
MSEMPYEVLTEQELDQLTEQALEEHESGRARFQRRDGTRTKGEGTVPISLRVPPTLLASIKAAAAERGIPYQRLIKVWLEEGLARNAPDLGSKAVTLRLSEEQAAQLRQSGSLDIHLEAS